MSAVLQQGRTKLSKLSAHRGPALSASRLTRRGSWVLRFVGLVRTFIIMLCSRRVCRRDCSGYRGTVLEYRRRHCRQPRFLPTGDECRVWPRSRLRLSAAKREARTWPHKRSGDAGSITLQSSSVQSAPGKGARPSSRRNALCLDVASRICVSISTNSCCVAARSISCSPTAVLI
jgi:hypothetical protein